MTQSSAVIELGRGEKGVEEASHWAASNSWKQIENIQSVSIHFKEAAGTTQTVHASFGLNALRNESGDVGSTGENDLWVYPYEHGFSVCLSAGS